MLKRKEVAFEVTHGQEGQTIPRLELRSNLSNLLKTKLDLVFIKKVETKTGTTVAIGEASAYETAEQAQLVERKHTIHRNVSADITKDTGSTRPVEENLKKDKPEETESVEEKASSTIKTEKEIKKPKKEE